MRLGPSLLLFLVLLAAACGKPGSPSQPDSPPMTVARIPIESVTIRIAQSFPVQVFARVQGFVGDGCSSLLPIEQSRAGNVITLEIKRQRPRDAICTQIAILFDQDIRLEGEFRTGEYTLNVNGSASSFRVD